MNQNTQNMIEEVQSQKWTIITALDYVLEQAKDSGLSSEFWNTCKSALNYLSDQLGFTAQQAVILAALVEAGETMSWSSMSKFFGCSRLKMMTYSEEVENLIEKRWVMRSTTRVMGKLHEGIELTDGVVKALRMNRVFVPEKLDGMDIQQFMDKMEHHLDRTLNTHNVNFEENETWMLQLCKSNPELPLCKCILKYSDDIHVQSLLLLIALDYAQWADSEDEGLTDSRIDDLFPEEYETNFMRADLSDGEHVLIKDGLIEHKCSDGMADCERYSLTRYSKETLLAGYTPSRSQALRLQRNQQRADLKKHGNVKQKPMFYNDAEQEQIARLASLLSQENLPGIQNRLAEEGMRKGFACLFYGAPGTGKTETVYQIARQTGRDIMQIDIAGMRDKYVGESEKNIKAVFKSYRAVCKTAQVMPILFFNEADGIFGKRSTYGGLNPSVEKMDNAMQNIILQELEDLDGILIATTNLTCNLDTAFDRRFLFKIDFKKPDDEVRAKLWTSMLGEGISADDAAQLAKRYDFSGGQIENIARKRTIDYILSGKKATFEEIDKYCQSEMLGNKNQRTPIGF